MRFAHMSDVHLGVWSNHPELKELSVQAFEQAIDRCIAEQLDFIVIAGDLFDTSLPPIDILKRAAAKFRQCKEAGLRIYAVPGSHDFSPTGKTMLGVLEESGLMTNVARSEEADGKTRLIMHRDKSGALICGIGGKKGALEDSDFENLEREYDEKGFKIFIFHSAISEYRPPHLKDMRAVSLQKLPLDFDYYAAGHIHMKHIDEESRVFFPGSVFPCDFDELEKNQCGFYIVDEKVNYEWIRTTSFGIVMIKLSVDGMSVSDVEEHILGKIEKENLENSILMLKLEGVLNGKQSDINFKAVSNKALEKGAISVKRSVHITSNELGGIAVKPNTSIELLEKEVVKDHKPQKSLFQLPPDKEEKLVFDLMNLFKDEKQEDEATYVFEERVRQNAKKVLGI
ncbi:MAG: exonuclease SbcCD subunit D [Candidatus Aenigmarchaeota archaeon]|nr:exonuclease SbcCD subunit D [Candidatus Aenigmarchaeota archaeon]